MEKERLDQVVAGTVILIIGIAGVAINISALVVIYRSQLFHNSFGILCASHLISDIGFLLPHVFWAAPAELLGWPASITNSFYAERIGQLLVLFCNFSIYSQLHISFNRLIAVVAPMSYSNLFSSRRTAYFVALFLLISILRCSVHFIDGCGIVHKVDSFIWKEVSSSCNFFVALYLEYVIGTTICVIVIVMNIITSIALFKYTKKLSTVGTTFARTEANMRRSNINFFLQSCTQAIIFATALSIYYFFSKFATTKWQIFATRTLTWEMAHSVNGISIFIFNDNFRCNIGCPILLCRRNAVTEISWFRSKFS